MKYNILHNIFAVIVAFSMLLLSASCSKQETPITPEEPSMGEIITLSATMELPESDTKTSLGVDYVVNWSTGDKLSVFFGENTSNQEFTLSTGEDTQSGSFTGTAPNPVPSTIYAVYPYNAATTIEGSTVTLSLPATQTYREGGFAEGMNPAVAYTTTGGNLTFKNLCGILELKLKVAAGTKTIKKITLWSSESKLSGIGTVAMSEETPTLTMSSTASNSVTLDLGSGVELTTDPKSFYIVVPATIGSLTVTLYDSEEKTMTKSTSSSITRNTIRPMPVFNYVADPILTANVTSITAASAVSGGEVASGSEVSARGVVWSTSLNPTVALSTKTIDGSGAGTFTSAITGLAAGTSYYVRAYATNSEGTFYGEQKFFITPNYSFTVGTVTFGMIEVTGGTFTMGGTSEQGSDPEDKERPTHQVTLSTYSIGQYEVTQGLWKAVMDGANPSRYPTGDNYPVEQVTWPQCSTFVSKLNTALSSQLDGKRFALPTEAQWEYAARGRQSEFYKYSGSNTIGDVAWYKNNVTSPKQHRQVGTKAPNQLGIYDMSGNVCEWCNDRKGDYSSEAQTDPTGPSSGTNYIVRGGNYANEAILCRVSWRADHSNDYKDVYSGFRLVLITAE